MPGNKAVAYIGPGKVEVREIDYPWLELRDGPGVNPANVGRQVPHGAILKCVATNICGSDQHMVRGRTTAPEGLVLGHEITGEVVEVGPGVEFNQGRRSVLSAVQHLLRPLPELQRGTHWRLPQRQPGSARVGLRVRRYGRLGRWPGRVRPGSVRGLEPAEVPR
jgi:NADPH:quinone reductase-like Zn-dependent oxidoreductase